MLPTSRDNPFASSDPFAATTPMRDEVDQFESVDINAPGGLFSGTSAGELQEPLAIPGLCPSQCMRSTNAASWCPSCQHLPWSMMPGDCCAGAPMNGSVAPITNANGVPVVSCSSPACLASAHSVQPEGGHRQPVHFQGRSARGIAPPARAERSDAVNKFAALLCGCCQQLAQRLVPPLPGHAWPVLLCHPMAESKTCRTCKVRIAASSEVLQPRTAMNFRDQRSACMPAPAERQECC